MKKRTFVVWLFVAALLAAETGALTHEFDHAFGKHNVPCAQHALVDSFGKSTPSAGLLPTAVAITEIHQPTAFVVLRLSAAFPPYRVRAPPRFSIA